MALHWRIRTWRRARPSLRTACRLGTHSSSCRTWCRWPCGHIPGEHSRSQRPCRSCRGCHRGLSAGPSPHLHETDKDRALTENVKRPSDISCTKVGQGWRKLSSLEHLILSSVPYLGKVMHSISWKMSMPFIAMTTTHWRQAAEETEHTQLTYCRSQYNYLHMLKPWIDDWGKLIWWWINVSGAGKM